MNTIGGRAILKESGAGIPDLLIVLYHASSAPSLAPAAPFITVAASHPPAANRLGSVLTESDGSFTLDYDDSVFTSNASGTGLDLHLSVLAPDEVGITPEAQVLYSATAPRLNAGRTESYLIRLTTAQLQKAGIPLPSEIPEDLEPAPNVLGRLNALVARQAVIVDGHIGAARQLVDFHRARFAGFHQTFKPALVAAISRLPASPLDPDRYVAAGESVSTKSTAVIKKGLLETVNADDPAKRAPARGFISLTDAQVGQLRAQLAPDGTVPGTAVAALAASGGPNGPTTYVQAADRLPLCQPPAASFDCANTALTARPGQPASPAPPPGVPGPGVTAITAADIPQYLARLIDSMKSPEEALASGLMPVATLQTVQDAVQSFVFNPSPADVPAFHDFNSLQIAFDYVWQEAIDQGILALAQDAYETIVGLGGNPDHPDYQTGPPVSALTAEGNLVIKANATPTIIVRDHRGEAPGTRLAPPANAPPSGSPSDSCRPSENVPVYDHRGLSGSPAAIADPTQRLPALLEELNKKLQQKYSFTVYAANAQEHSVNFGILNTYRQIWTPLSYQAGPLVKSIPLAPKQTQKLVITRKTTRKRSRKELTNNLSVFKDETSVTDRAEQEIADKASTNTSFVFSNEAKGDFEIGSDTSTTSFKQDAAKSSDDTKKQFHESVFKSSQEFKNEKTTEINTEETHDYESIETTEISNPNDEIAVTFMFYELQRRYRIYERLYRVQPVVLVAQEFPQPQDIDQAWLVKNDWILRRAILDDSFLPTLGNLTQTSGEEIALAEMQINVNQQRCIVQELRQELAIASQQATAQRALMDQAVYQKSGASDSGLFGSVGDIVSDVTGVSAVAKVGSWLFGGDSSQNDSNRQAMQERANQVADQVRDLMFRLEREVTALNALTESYTKALREYNNHLTEIARLIGHVVDNAMYYIQAIWTHEPPDQRYFRLHNVPIPDFAHESHGFRVDFGNAMTNTMAPAHLSLARFGGRDARIYPYESVTKFTDNIQFRPLSQVADLDHLLGFKGNYMIFPLNESNLLTDFMMDPYIDRATGQLVDPSDPVNWSIDEFTQYVCCLEEKLTSDEFQKLLPLLRETYQIILTNPLRNDDVLVVPTNSLFIAALPDSHTLLEQFKLYHRMVDAMKAAGEARGAEVENLRRTARLLAGEREDPNIDQRVLIQGDVPGVVVPPPIH